NQNRCLVPRAVGAFYPCYKGQAAIYRYSFAGWGRGNNYIKSAYPSSSCANLPAIEKLEGILPSIAILVVLPAPQDSTMAQRGYSLIARHWHSWFLALVHLCVQ